MVGLEPTRLAPLPPQSSVSTSSTTSALKSSTIRPHLDAGAPGGDSGLGVADPDDGASGFAGAAFSVAEFAAGAGAVGAAGKRSITLCGPPPVCRPPRYASTRLVAKKSAANVAVV